MIYKRQKRPRPGETVILTEVPPGLLDDLPGEDRKAISEIVGKPITLNEYEDDGRAELEFRDAEGNFHLIYVSPNFIRPSKS
jgi:hypothetical protein